MRKGKKATPKQAEDFTYRVNEQIRVPEVRLVGENIQGFIAGTVYKTSEAKKIAADAGLDLIEISPNANPPVCRIMDIGKFKYELKRQQKSQDAKQRENKVETKEIRLGPTTGEGDLEFKRNHAIKFLKDGNIVRLNMLFKGRMITHKEIGKKLMLEFAQSLNEHGIPVDMPQLQGKFMKMDIRPSNTKSR